MKLIFNFQLWGCICLLAIINLFCSSCFNENSSETFTRCKQDTLFIKKDGYFSQLDDKDYVINVETHLSPKDSSNTFFCDRIKFDNGYYFLSETGKNQTIWVFDSLGNYVSKLGERGRKENEYQNDITDWFYIKDQEEVLVYERSECMIRTFAINGNHKNTQKMISWPHAIGAIEGDKIFCSFDNIMAKDGIQLGILNRDEKVIETFINLKDDMDFVPSNSCFYSNEEKMYHIPCFADSAIVFNHEKVEKVVHFSFEDKFLTKEIKEEACNAKLDNFHRFKGIQFIENYYETSRFHYLCFVQDGKFVNLLIDKNNNKQYQFTSSLTKGLFPSSVLCVRGEKILYLITKQNVEDIRHLVEPEALNKFLSMSDEVIRRIFRGEESLPLILSIEIKK